MKTFRDWSRPARFFTFTVVALLLTIGLCSFGTGFDQREPSTRLRDVSAWVGVLTFLCFLGMLLTTLIVSVRALVQRRKQ